jgi:translation initiation factor 3 subunit D
VQQAEDKAYLTANFQGPQQTKKRQQWAAQVAKANNQSQQSQQVSMSWSKRGIRELSFEPKNEWEIVEDFSKQGFEKLKPLTPEFVSCEVEAGKLFAFDNAWTKVKMLKFKKIPQFKGLVPNEATTRDSIIQQLAQDGKANIFATDIAAAALMTSSKAAFSWDLVIKKFEGLLFIDKRDDENILDWQTVSETAGVEF